MKQLFTGIYSKFTSGTPAIYTNLGGRLRLHKARQGETLPYAVYYMIGTGHEYYFGAQRIYSTTIQFNMYDESASAENICTYFDNLTTLYDDCDLTVTGYTFLRMKRSWDYLLQDVEADVWQQVVQYQITMEKLT